MKVKIDKKVFEKFHEDFMVGVIFCSAADNSRSPADVHEMLRDVEELVRINFKPETASEHEMISAWRAAVAHFGEKAAHYQSSAEKLMMLALEGKDIESENVLVDLCNFISLKYIVPVGATDAKKVAGDFEFRIAQGNEAFSIGKKIQKAEKDELVIKDKVKLIARKLDYSENPKTAVGKSTTKAIVHIEALPPVSAAKLRRITEELAGLIKVFCGCKVKIAVLDKENSGTEF